MERFSQRRFLNRITVEFQKDGISYSNGNFISSANVFVPYEEIAYENVSRFLETDKVNLRICIIALSFVVKSTFGILQNPESIYKGILPVSIIFFVVFLLATFFSRKHLLHINTFNLGSIVIYEKDTPEVEEFLKTLKNKVIDFLKSKYANIDKDLDTQDQLKKLIWLKEREVISQKEFEHLKSQLID